MSGVPFLVIEIPLEGVGLIGWVCESHEDELRLRAWLRSSDQLARLATILARLLDDLDDFDEEPFDRKVVE